MITEKLDEGLYRTVADNGVSVLSVSISGVRSVTVGIWIKAASAHEPRGKMGLSHLLEHMVFKGTRRRSAREIALELEARGGSLDAFTSRDHTSFQARVLDEDLPRALDVLTDLLREPVLRESDLDLERKVVLEEISTVEDTPDDLVFDLHSSTLWPDHSYGFSILGTRDTVEGLTSADLRGLHQRAYHPRQAVIAAAGSLDHEVLLKLLAKCGWFSFNPGPEPAEVSSVPAASKSTERFERDTVQTHVVFGTDTFPFVDRRRYPLMLLNQVLGSGMSSRLFQRVREKLGLAYTVFSYQSFYRHSGVTGVYVGTHPSTASQAVACIREELDKLADEGLPPEDLARAKQQLKGQITLSLESPAAQMYRIAGLSLHNEPYRTLDQVLADVDRINADEVAEVASEFFPSDKQSVVWLGPN